MSIRSWWNKKSARDKEEASKAADRRKSETPEELRFSSVDIAGHSAAAEAKRLGDRA